MKYIIVAIFALTVPAFGRPQAPAPVPAQPQAQAAALHPQLHPQAQPAAQPPQPHPQAQNAGPTTPATIISQTEDIGVDGNFNYSYETSNGIHVEQGGHVKKGAESKSINGSEESGDIQVIQGAFSYTAPDGQQISVRYIADDQGFQPQGEHIPTNPPVPEAIARSLGQQQDQQQQGHEQQHELQHPPQDQHQQQPTQQAQQPQETTQQPK